MPSDPDIRPNNVRSADTLDGSSTVTNFHSPTVSNLLSAYDVANDCDAPVPIRNDALSNAGPYPPEYQ